MTYKGCPTPGAEKREAIVQDCTFEIENNPQYVLTAKVDGKTGEKLFIYCTNQPIDCHWLVRIRKDGEEYDFHRDMVVGVVHRKRSIAPAPPKREIAEGLYKTVLKYARNRVDNDSQITNETSRGREKKSKLEFDKLRLRGPPPAPGSG